MSDTLYVIIVGCGRLGSLLANRLSGEGHDVVVIDRREEAFDSLSVEFSGFKIVGDAVERAVLRQAEVEKADFLFSVTTEDNINLMVAQIANRIFDVKHVIARIDDPAREAIYREFGITTISPTQLTAEAYLNVVTEEIEARDS